jgi:hypothetical protein
LPGYHYDKYHNYIDHDEPVNFTKDNGTWKENPKAGHFSIAARDSMGRFIAEEGPEGENGMGAFYVVNNKKLSRTTKEINDRIYSIIGNTQGLSLTSLKEELDNIKDGTTNISLKTINEAIQLIYNNENGPSLNGLNNEIA